MKPLDDTREFPAWPSPTFYPQENLPRSLYIHIPFCRHRCGYCNFSLVAGRDYLVDRFLVALETEIGWLNQSYELDTLFLGGGTPSHLSPAQLDRLREILATRFTFAANAEVTAECNPNDLDTQCATALAGLGVNRISLGVQSLNPGKLKRLERDHTPGQIRSAIEQARGLNAQVSLDLIFAAPQETIADWESDLSAALALSPDHVSTYELTYEKGTRFWNSRRRGDLHQSDEDLRAQMYTMAIEYLESFGLLQYEVSSFAAAQYRCRHNLGYWNGDSYFAFGPGAARFVDGIRETNHRSTLRYLKLIESGLSPVAEQEKLDAESAAREQLAIGLRMVDGLDEVEFHQRTGFWIAELLGDFGQELKSNDLLCHANKSWRLTHRGIMVCDWIAGQVVSAD